MPEITLADVIRVADRGYPDSLVMQAHLEGDVGDTLATFIAREIEDSFDLEDVADNAYHYAADILIRAKQQLEDVIDALRDEARKVDAAC